MLRVQVLGTVDASVDGASISPGGPRERLVLSLLALGQGQVVSRDRLVDAIWESDPPESAVTQVAIHISRLRKAVGRADVIETVGQGYRLATDGVEVDARVAEHMLREARETQKPELFRDALAMWRGPVLDGVDSAAITPAKQRLEELYLTGVEDWSAVELDTGGERALLEVLPDVVARHPLREGLRARLIEALWHDGRRADALASFDEGRRALVDELGIDPGDELTRLHHQILQDTAQPRIGPTGSSDPANEAAWTIDVPRQLPIDVSHFSGRADDAGLVRSQLLAEGRHSVVIGVHGPGGVGKTTLAVHVAHQVADQFPDGQLFVNLRGYGTTDPVDAGTVLGSMLRSLGVPEREIPPKEDDRSRVLRSVLAGRRILMVLDNARDSFQIRPLLPGGSVAVLVTSRMQLRSLATREGAQRVHVKEMTSKEAVDLLRSRRSPQTTQWAEPDVAELARLCGHLPVALAVAAERANRYPDRPLAELNTELRDGHAALDTLTAWEDDPATSVRAVMAWSVDALGADAARMFQLLGLHPHPALDVNAAAALAALDLREASRLLDPLVDSHLLTERRPGEYEMHDLVHAFAANLAHAEVGKEERAAAVARMRAHYLHTLDNIARVLHAIVYEVELPDRPADVYVADIAIPAVASQWFTNHEPALRAVLDEASTSGDHRTALLLSWLAGPLYRQLGRFDDHVHMYRAAMTNARLDGDVAAEAQSTFKLGASMWRTGDLDAALTYFIAAGERFASLGDGPSRERAMMAQGLIMGDLDRHDEAIRATRAAVDSARSHNRVTPELLNSLAMAHLLAGRPDHGLLPAEEAVREARRTGLPAEETMTLDTVGIIHLKAGRPDAAVRAFEEALVACEPIWPAIVKPSVLLNLGLAQRAQGMTDSACDSWNEALRLLDELEAPDSVDLNRAQLRALIDHPDQADDATVTRSG